MNVTLHIPRWARHVVSDFTDMDRSPHPVDAAKVSRFSFELPDDVYFEYAFLDEDGKMRSDPENDTKAENPWYPNASAILGPEYVPDPHANVDKGFERNQPRRHRLKSEALGQERRLIFYTPEGHEGEVLPCVYVQDGLAYLRVARLAAVLEALLETNLVRPAHLVFIEPLDRTKEYAFNPDYRTFIYDELIPYVERELTTSDERIAMGASLGGLVSTTLALTRPDIFSAVVAQSGAFLGDPHDRDFYRSETSWVLQRLEQGAGREVRFYTETGTIEWLTNINRRVRDVLSAQGYVHRYDERNAGHNWTNWRNGLSQALRFVLNVSESGWAA
jgi:enterochelin esterase-like enzyme